jgi:rhamnulokinase
MKASESVYLGFDLGASNGRAVLGLLHDRRMTIKEISRFANAPCQHGDRWSWDFPSLWNNVRSAMRLCAKQGYRHLSGVGVDTWGVDFGLLDANGRLLANPICYRDPMTDGIERRIALAISQEELYRLTGTPFTRVSTLSQLAALAQSPAAGTLKSAKTLLMMPDLFRYYLCGHKGIELTAAGSSQLLNVQSARWSAKLFGALHLPCRIMPEIIQLATVVGRMSQALAAETGLNRAPVVAVAGHDTASAAAAVPLVGADTAFISCGTWLMIGSMEDRPITTADALRRGFVNLPGLESILFVKDRAGLYLFENLYRALRQTNRKLTYAQLLREASQAKPLSHFVDANWPGFFAVENTESAIRDFLRQTGQQTPRNIGLPVRTLLEGLAWSCRGAIQDLAAITGRTLRRISLVGGGARNALLCQMIADAAGLEVTAGPAEAAAAGNLAVQALATGRLRGVAEIRDLIRNSFRLKKYLPKETELWNRHESRYLEIAGRATPT